MSRPDGSNARAASVAIAVALAAAALSIPLAAAVGEPYVSVDSINLGLVAFAIAAFAALFALPFAIQGRMIAALESRREGSSGTPLLRDRAWERSLLIWGGICVLVLLAGALMGFETDTLAAALVTVAAADAGLVVGTIAVLLISG